MGDWFIGLMVYWCNLNGLFVDVPPAMAPGHTKRLKPNKQINE